MSDLASRLLSATAALVDIPSVSHHEGEIADYIESLLRPVPWLDVERVADNVVARTQLGRAQRLVVAGHIDTVPANGNERATKTDDRVTGLGACDMKGGIAVALDLASTVAEPTLDVTYVFYACEEVAAKFNGLVHLLEHRADLLACDAAILGEPTGARVEAGCQGTVHVGIDVVGERAHTARPWMGTNAIHRLGVVLDRIAAYEARTPVLDGCEYREAIQAVQVEGFVAFNVVPDKARVVVNHRFAPDRDVEDAVANLQAVVGDAVDTGRGDTWEVVGSAEPAPPGLTHPILRSLVDGTGQPPRAKLGWTDVAFFATRGTPATNYGPGDPTLAHTAGEFVTAEDLVMTRTTLGRLLGE